MNDFDFIAIGDVVTDAFIRLKDATVEESKEGGKRLSMRFGDKIPYESVTVVPGVGNAPNAAVAAARLGLKSALVSNIGTDDNGKEILASLKENKVDTKFITEHHDQKSNYHYVLWFKDDRTILVKHEEYLYNLPVIGKPKWIYLSSLGENSLAYHQSIIKYLEYHPEVKLAFQPGTFQIKLGKDELAGLYKITETFFCNVEEARKILDTKETDVKKLLDEINKLGPKIVVITDGPAGAYMLANGEYWQMPIYPDPQPPISRTGAGDAYAATFTAALAMGKTPLEALTWAPVNSMSVVQYVGAQRGLLSKGEIETYLARALADYEPKKI